MGYKDLAYAIVEQAVEDYKLLLSEGRGRAFDYKTRSYVYKKEIERFFNSEWCDILLFDFPHSGEDILRELQR